MEEEHTTAEQTREQAEEQMVNKAFEQLLQSYLESPHRKKIDKITKAFNFAKQAHKGVRRLSGEPYIMHPIAVAMIASKEIGLGSTSICSALLHDVVEDTDYTVEDIENIFGPKIAQIVDGLTKISGGIFGDQASAQAENIKKLLLTMSDDIRVIVIKICDRLHNMRTLASQPANKQYKIAGETQYIYAPLANRLGLNRVKNELEDLSFRYEHPEEYRSIKDQLAALQDEVDEQYKLFTEPIRRVLDNMGMQYELRARVKSPFSIWKKMQAKHLNFDQIYDILAVRIIFKPRKGEDEVNECFKIYAALDKLYTSHPDRFRNWLSHPKANGYQALHTTLMSKQGQYIEVQIRSERMDEIAEKGFAAHWKYKEGDNEPENAKITEEDDQLNSWLATIQDILSNPQPDAMDFLDIVKLNLFAKEIFVFSPKGEIITMPAGCSALDFAFQIHTFLGSHCIGAKVNHKLVPISHKLQSGDQVEILTSNSAHPVAEWMNFATTAKAKAKIQASLRRDERKMQKDGEEILKEFLSRNDLEMTTATLDKLCKMHEVERHETLLQNIGDRRILLGEKDLDELLQKKSSKGGWRKYVPFLNSEKKKDEDADKDIELMAVDKDFNRKKPLYISEENIHKLLFPTCCHTIPGDDALGFIDGRKHIIIHRRNCSVADKLKTSFGNRLLDVKWNMHKRMFFDATIQIRGIDRIGLLNDVTQVLSGQLNVNIHRISISSEEGIFDGQIEMRVHDRENVHDIMKKLNEIDGLKEILEVM